MQCVLDRSSPQLNPSGKKRPPRRRLLPARRARLELDPVRATRLRVLIERCVLAGLDTSDIPHAGSVLPRLEILRLAEPRRGGAATAFARQVAMYLAHVGCELTLTEAARIYGRDRTTAAHACGVVEERRDDEHFDRIIELLERCVQLGLTQIEPTLIAQRLATRHHVRSA